jgi:hypothetical protein
MTVRARLLQLPALAAALAAAALPVSGDGSAFHYEVATVSGKLLRVDPEPETRLEAGARAEPGETLRTGWSSHAELLVPERATRFSLQARTTVRLATEQPGVLLEVERGKVRAVFDALTGEQAPERLVTTPSAVLAVRGTEYGIEVDSNGDTTLAVFAGVVEVTDLGRQGPPLRIGAGLAVSVHRGQPPGRPEPHRLTPRDWDRGRSPRLESAGPGEQQGAQSSQPGAGAEHRTGQQGSGRRPHG